MNRALRVAYDAGRGRAKEEIGKIWAVGADDNTIGTDLFRIIGNATARMPRQHDGFRVFLRADSLDDTLPGCSQDFVLFIGAGIVAHVIAGELRHLVEYMHCNKLATVVLQQSRELQ